MTEPCRVQHIDLERDPRSVSRAREFFSEVAMGAALPEDRTEIGCLAVSELVTNAILHGSDPVAVTTVVDADALRVMVTDGSAAEPVISQPAPLNAAGGRGLMIVAALTDLWGWERGDNGQGKRIWFELRRDD